MLSVQSRSLRFKLVTSVIVLVALIVFSFTAVSYLRLEADFKEGLESSAETITEPFHRYISRELPADADDVDIYLRVSIQARGTAILGELPERHRNLENVMFALPGNVIFSTYPAAMALPAPLMPLLEEISGTTQLIEFGDHAVVSVPFTYEGRVLGATFLLFSRDAVRHRQEQLLQTASLILGVFLLIGIGGALYVGQRIAQPIHEFALAIANNSQVDPEDWRSKGSELEVLARHYRTLRDDLALSFTELKSEMDKVERANAAKTAFLNNISHELRTPLNAIIGMSDVMRGETFGPIGVEKYRTYLEDINHSGSYLLELINDLLDVTTIEAGNLEIHDCCINLAACIDSSVSMVLPAAKEKCLTVSSRVTPRELLLVADLRRVRQILINLLSNAVKFAEPDSEITVTAQFNRDELCIAVHNTGRGIAPEDRENVFEPFNRGGDPLVRNSDGTGLGLSIVRLLMEQFGGRASLESELGQGTTVLVWFPRTRVKMTEAGT